MSHTLQNDRFRVTIIGDHDDVHAANEALEQAADPLTDHYNAILELLREIRDDSREGDRKQ